MPVQAISHRTASTAHRWRRWSLFGCVLNAAAWAGSMLYAAGGPQRLLSQTFLIGLAFLMWPLLGSALMCGVVLLTTRMRKIAPLIAATAVALLLATTTVSLIYIFSSQSSTAALGFLSFPLIEIGIAVLAGLGALLVDLLPVKADTSRST